MEKGWTSTDLIQLELWRDGEYWTCKIVGIEKTFTSRHSLWAKAHALQYYADELYRIKQLTTPLD